MLFTLHKKINKNFVFKYPLNYEKVQEVIIGWTKVDPLTSEQYIQIFPK